MQYLCVLCSIKQNDFNMYMYMCCFLIDIGNIFYIGDV
jgi:hypothetical protein